MERIEHPFSFEQKELVLNLSRWRREGLGRDGTAYDRKGFRSGSLLGSVKASVRYVQHKLIYV